MRGIKLALVIALGLFGSAGLARADGGRVVSDVSYLGAGGGPKLDLYLPVPDTDGGLHPALVWIHGNNQNKGTGRARDFCGILSDEGFVCASVDYGPRGEWLGNILDCKNAVRFLRANAATYRIDPARLAVVGISAGGYLALMTGLTEGKAPFEPAKPWPGVSSAVGAIVDFFGVVDGPRYSPLEQIRADSPPILILHGTADAKVSYLESVRLDRALTAKGAKHRLILLKDLPHGFNLSPAPDNPMPMDLRPIVVAFLRENLGAAKATAPERSDSDMRVASRSVSFREKVDLVMEFELFGEFSAVLSRCWSILPGCWTTLPVSRSILLVSQSILPVSQTTFSVSQGIRLVS